MIAQIRGKILQKTPTEVVIDCNGLGYLVEISLHTYEQISNLEEVQLFTYLQVREDAHRLFGFFDSTERVVFKLLLSVSGIGANTARTMLSSLSPKEVAQAIAYGDVKTIQSVKGIGAKTAQRVIIDLKDKVMEVLDEAQISLQSNNREREEALSALEILGYQRKIAQKVVDKICEETPEATIEQIIKQALKRL